MNVTQLTFSHLSFFNVTSDETNFPHHLSDQILKETFEAAFTDSQPKSFPL